MAYNQYGLANTSLVKTGSLTEMYIPLWFYSSGSATGSGATTPGNMFIGKSGNTVGYNYNDSRASLHKLNANWSTTQKFAFEASVSTTNGNTQYFALWDCTSNTQVSTGTISTTVTTFTVFRTSQFTLTPGHVYGVSIWCPNSTGDNYKISKASLIAFLS